MEHDNQENDMKRLREILIFSKEHKGLIIIVNVSMLQTFKEYYDTLRYYYQISTDIMVNEGNPLMDLRVLLFPNFCQSSFTNSQIFFPPSVTLADKSRLNVYQFAQFDTVAIGGSFDRLHAGHKLMLSVATMLTGKTLICGITGAEMLEKKSFPERIYDWEDRVKQLKDFLASFAPRNIKIEIVQLTDAYGPTIELADLDALIISPETLPGGESSINF